MKTIKQLLALLLAAVMTLTLLVPFCTAAPAGKPEGQYDIILPPDVFDDDPMDAFKDIVKGSWYYSAVSYMVGKGYMTGTSATTFAPNKGLTRAEFVMVLYKVLGGKPVNIVNPFTDVKKGSWYYDAVLWAYSKKITSGTTDTTFSPSAAVTREQVAVFLYSAFHKASDPKPAYSRIYDYPDWRNVSTWARTAMDWAIMKGCISGVEQSGKVTLEPKKTATRAQLAVIIYKMKQ